MGTEIVFTLTGPDRVGIVEQVSRLMLGLNGNVETSRMARLGGEFAILMLVTLPAEKAGELEAAFSDLVSQGYRISTSATARGGDAFLGWLPYQVEVIGADHEGIVHEVAQELSKAGINIESMETKTARAPISGTPLFAMTALVLVPPGLRDSAWMPALEEAGRQANVDVKIALAERE